MPIPTARAALLFALGGVLALAAVARPSLGAAVLGYDGAVIVLALLDFLLAPRARDFRAARRVREPLSAFAANPVEVTVWNDGNRAATLLAADAAPPGFATQGHRPRLAVPARGAAVFEYGAVPPERGPASFGDLALRGLGPLGLAARQWTVPLSHQVRVFPDLRELARGDLPGATETGLARVKGLAEGREFAGLRAYVPGDDFRAIDWKATARRGSPVAREFQPERNQTLWLLLDCGRHLAGRVKTTAPGAGPPRTKLDFAVDAALALARAAARRGDQVGVVLFGAEVTRVVPPGRGSTQLGPIADALSTAQARVEESDYDAAFDALLARQRRRSLVVTFTDLADEDTSALLIARAAQLRGRHLALVVAVSDSVVADAAHALPRTEVEAFARAAAARIVEERETTRAHLQAAGALVESVPARQLTASVVTRYLSIKAAGRL